MLKPFATSVSRSIREDAGPPATEAEPGFDKGDPIMPKRLLAVLAALAACAAAPAGEDGPHAAPGVRAFKETGPASAAVRRITSNSPASQRRSSQDPRDEVVKLTLPSLGSQAQQPRYRMVEVEGDGEDGALKFNFENSVPIDELGEFPLPEVTDIAIGDRLESGPGETDGVLAAMSVDAEEPAEDVEAEEIVLFNPLAAPPALTEIAALPGLDPPEAADADHYNQMVLAPRPELDMLDLVTFDDDPNWTPELAFEPLGAFPADAFERQPAPAMLQVPPPIVRDDGVGGERVSAMSAPHMAGRHPKSPKVPPAMVDLTGASPGAFSRGRPPPSLTPPSALPAEARPAVVDASSPLRPPSSFDPGATQTGLVPSPADLGLVSGGPGASQGVAPSAPMLPPPGFLTSTPSLPPRMAPPPVQDYGLSGVQAPAPRRQTQQTQSLKQYAEIAEIDDVDGFVPMREVKFY